MAFKDFAFLEQAAQVARHGHLARMGPDGVYPFIEGVGTALQGLEAHAGQDIGRADQHGGPMQDPGAIGRHELRAIDEAEPVLGCQGNRLETVLGQHLRCGSVGAARPPEMPEPYERQCHMRQGCQVPGGAHRPA